MITSVTVKVPATTANLGPGFDCLGMALDLWNTVELTLGGDGLEVTGEGADTLPRDDSNLVHRSALRLFAEAGERGPALGLRCHNEIPLYRGLGSSAAAVVGGLFAANELCARPVSIARLMELAAEVEGHADNAAPALFGGCRVVAEDCGKLCVAEVPIPEGLLAVAFIPDMPMPTREARRVLPPTVTRADTVFNLARVALLVAGLSQGKLDHLAVATQDRLHQPARQSIFPAMGNIMRAAIEAGAYGAFLSGAGSTVVALTRGREMTVGYEMAEAAQRSGVSGRVHVTRPTPLGAHRVNAGQ